MSHDAKIPLSSFDPRLKQLLLRGAREKFEIPCKSPKQAHRLQSVLHTFRSKMKKANPDHPGIWEPLYGCIVGKKSAGSSILVLYPRGAEFDDVLDNIPDIEPEALEKDPLEGL